MFKLLVIDIDGVLTDGKYVDIDGKSVLKKFEDKDWTSIKKFKSCGIPVVAISGDLWNKNIMERRNIPFYCSKREDGFLDKASFLPILEKEYNVSRNDIAYVGDDYFDLDIMKLVGYPFCPKDSDTDVILYCDTFHKQFNSSSPYVLDKKGGKGVIGSLFEVCKYVFRLKIPDDLDWIIRKIDSMATCQN